MFKFISGFFVVLALTACGQNGTGSSSTSVTPNSITGNVSTITAATKISLSQQGASGVLSTTTVDASGNYLFTLPQTSGSYTVTPSDPSLAFNPQTSLVTVLPSTIGLANINFAGSTTYIVSGVITGPSVKGVTVTLHDPITGNTLSGITDSNGLYSISGVPNGTFTIIPSLAGYSFTPVNNIVTVASLNLTANNYVETAIAPAVISGYIAGSVLSGVTISLYGNSNSTTTTDVNGYFQFAGLSNGTYSLTPSLTGASFTPASLSATFNGLTVSGNNFTATSSSPSTGVISGTVTGTVVSGITLSLYGNSNSTTTTDVNGYYQFGNLTNGTYSVVPSYTGATFSPSKLSVMTTGVASSGNNFVITAPVVSVSGVISGVTTSGVSVALNGSGLAPVLTDSNGYYTFSNVPAGSYTLIPSLTGYVFSPISSVATVIASSLNGNNFTSSNYLHSISGTVLSTPGVTITLAGAAAATQTTDSNGNYLFSNVPSGSYTVTPYMTGEAITPTSSAVTVGTTNVSGVDFTATAIIPTYRIGGHVVAPSGTTITLGGGTSATANTDANGNYMFTGLPNGSYTVSASRTSMTFSPISIAVTLNGADSLLNNFNGTFVFNFNLTSSVSNYDVWSELIKAGWDGVTPVAVTVDILSGTIISSTDPTLYAFKIAGIFPTSSTMSLINNYYIVGKGGLGGEGSPNSTYDNGGNGGPALFIGASNMAVSITNNGTIGGGGGGGAGAAGSGNNCTEGGGGAGFGGNLHSAGNPDVASPGTVNAGGLDGGGSLIYSGGSLGVNGNRITSGPMCDNGQGAVGLAGAATSGYSTATWVTVGNILGTKN